MRPRNADQVKAFLARRADTRPRNEVPTVVVDGTIATLRLFDAIDNWGEWWGMSAAELASALDDLPADVTTIRVMLNSPGGHVYEGITMMNTLRAHPARIVAIVQGLAASAASFIAVSADETIMAPNSEMMIHDASIVCIGDAREMRATADDLDRISDNIASMYAAKAGGAVKTWRGRMLDETWYSAAEAVAAGLADRVDEPSPVNRHAADAAALAALRPLPDATGRNDIDELTLLAL